MISAQHFAEITNGYEKTSSGLWTHKGRAEVGSLRVNGISYSQRGAGVETIFDNTQPVASQYGAIQAYDRDNSAWRDLYINAKNINLQPQGGALGLPANSIASGHIQDGAIQTADIAANAVQQPLGSYNAAPTWSTTVNNWVLTPISTTFTTSGGLLRIEYTVSFYYSVVGGQWYVGLGWDGAVAVGLQYMYAAAANMHFPCSSVYYVTLGAGSHSIAIWVYDATAGTLSSSNNVSSTLWVTEQKR